MPVMDEFKKERESIKHAPFSEKLQYFADYYLLKLIVILFFGGVLISILVSALSQKAPALYVAMVNFNSLKESDSALWEPFAAEHINTRRETIVMDHSSFISSDENEINFLKYGYEDEQRLFSMVMTGEIDLFISGEDVIDRYVQQEWFDDLRHVLSTETLNRFEQQGRLVYRNEIPIAVTMDDSDLLKEYYFYNGRQGEAICAGIPAGSMHHELAEQFMIYLLSSR